MVRIEALANKLAQARLSGGTVPQNASEGIDTIEKAYSVQHVVENLYGMPRAGWKIGATSEIAQEALNTKEPVSAPMFVPTCYTSPYQLTVHKGQGVSVESEFGFRFKSDLPPRGNLYKLDEVLDAVDIMFPVIEVVGSRWEGGLGNVGPVRLVADMVSHIGLITGPDVTNWREIDLPAHIVTLYQNGEEIVEGKGANTMGSPLLVLEWTANHLSARGESIVAGEIISTGTCTGITPVSNGDELIADFGNIGKVKLQITEQ